MARDESQHSSLDRSLPRLAPGIRVGLVVSTYHRHVTGGMAERARATLGEAGLDLDDGLLAVDAPGAFEIPLLAQALAERKDIAAVLSFGLILKGETEHDRHIAGAVAQGLMDLGLRTGKPILFGILTCNTLGQAERRARSADQGGLDKGREVASAAIEALNTLGRIASAS